MGHARRRRVRTIDRAAGEIPDRLSWIEAAAWLNVFTTSHDAMVTNAGLKRGESVLINALAGTASPRPRSPACSG